jgi:ribosomal protein L34E
MGRKVERACPYCGEQLTSKFFQSAAGRILSIRYRRQKTVITTCPHCGSELDPETVISTAASASVAQRKHQYVLLPEDRPQPQTKPCQWCGLPITGWRARREHARKCPEKPA